MDENTQVPEPALNEQPAVEAPAPETSPVEETNTSVEQTTEQPVEGETPVEQAAVESDAERQQVRPAQRRIQSLVEENKQLKQLVGQYPSAPPQPLQAPRLSQLLEGRESIDPSELDKLGEQLVAQASSSLVDLKVQGLEQKLVQQEAYKNLEADTALLPREFPELDPNSDSYIPQLEEAISEAWKVRAVQLNPYNPELRSLNPDVRLTDIAKELVGVARAAAEKGKASASNSVASIADTASVQPTPETKAVQTDSLEALKDSLAGVKF